MINACKPREQALSSLPLNAARPCLAPQSSNVMLTASGGAKLGDVGLSKRQNRTYLSDVGAVGTFDW